MILNEVVPFLFRPLTKELAAVKEASLDIEYEDFSLFQCNDPNTRTKWKRNLLRHLFYDMSESLQMELNTPRELKELTIAERRVQQRVTESTEQDRQQAAEAAQGTKATNDTPAQKSRSRRKRERRKQRTLLHNERDLAFERALSPDGTKSPSLTPFRPCLSFAMLHLLTH